MNDCFESISSRRNVQSERHASSRREGSLMRHVVASVCLLWSGVCGAQYPAPNAPPLPPPTEEQLAKGRDLLDKLLLVVKDVNLYRPSDVFRVFGVEQTVIEGGSQPSREVRHVRIVPHGDAGRERLNNAGIRGIKTDYYFDRTLEKDVFGIGIVTAKVCVSFDDVRRVFGPLGKKISNPAVMGGYDVHQAVFPARMHEYNVMRIELTGIEREYAVTATFSFAYQTCATGAGIGFSTHSSKEQ